MKQLILSILFSIGIALNANSQIKSEGVFVQFNTILVYSNYTINYESKSLFSQIEQHHLKFSIGLGGWQTSAFNKNTGVLLNYGLQYLFGKSNHFLALTLIYQNHFDRGLKGQFLTYIGSTFRPGIGYRFQPESKSFFFKLGTGWREVVQLGVGYKF